MKIGIVGYGYVGQAMHRLFKDAVWAVQDPNVLVRAPGDISECDLAIICVPTPMATDGACDTSIVEEVASKITVPLVLIKSTVAPGTTERLNERHGERFAFSPEYLGEGGYFVPFWRYPDPHDAAKHSFVIFGGPRRITQQMVDVFTPVMGPHVTYSQTDSRTAEVVKYMENCWIATKVTWANEMYDACEALGIDYREARELWALDSRVDKMHSAVFPDKRGFGGKCIPKDLSAFIAACEARGYAPALLEAVRDTNARVRGEA